MQCYSFSKVSLLVVFLALHSTLCDRLGGNLKKAGDSTYFFQSRVRIEKANADAELSVAGHVPLARAIPSKLAGKTHKLEETLKEMFDAACDDLRRRRKPHFIGFNGTGKTFHVRYRIAPAGHKGLGAFAAESVKYGTKVYGDFWKPAIKHYLHVVPDSMFEVAKSVASKYPKDVVKHLMQWCEGNFLTREGGILCELDDEHFVNSDSKPNIAPCSWRDDTDDGKDGLCAVRDIAVGEELLEDYNAEGLDDDDSDHFANALIKKAGSHVGAATKCLAD
jgi:hypothetical protein